MVGCLVGCNADDSSNRTLAFEDAQVIPPSSTYDTGDTDYTDDTDDTDDTDYTDDKNDTDFLRNGIGRNRAG